MRVSLKFNHSQQNRFRAECNAVISKVGNGSRKALVEACNVISEDSLNQVPRDTNTLALSQYWEITGNYRTGWSAEIGYGGNGDPINPKTGKPASSYMLTVHEDLSAYHVHGKAKFLEDPLRAYAQERFPRTVFRYIQSAIAD